MKRVRLGNFHFAVGQKSAVTGLILRRLRRRQAGVYLPTSLNDLAAADEDFRLGRNYRQVNVCVTDGMPLVWFFNTRNLLGGQPQDVERVYGPTLMREILLLTGAEYRHFFYGSTPATLRALKKNLHQLSPRIKIEGMTSPPFGELSGREEAKYLAQVRRSQPDVLWIGLSSPKQVVVATRWTKFLPQTTIICVGAAFDFLAGQQRTAPAIIQKVGLEWLFRLWIEPQRLGKRYLVTIPGFLGRQFYRFWFN